MPLLEKSNILLSAYFEGNYRIIIKNKKINHLFGLWES